MRLKSVTFKSDHFGRVSVSEELGYIIEWLASEHCVRVVLRGAPNRLPLRVPLYDVAEAEEYVEPKPAPQPQSPKGGKR